MLETYLTDIAGYWKCNIVAGQDPYLYGEKMRAYLISGARQLPSGSDYLNPQLGWGALCVSDSLPVEIFDQENASGSATLHVRRGVGLMFPIDKNYVFLDKKNHIRYTESIIYDSFCKGGYYIE